MTGAEQVRLYAEYRDRVMRYIRARVNRREDAEDLCQDVFERAYRSAATYDAGKAAPGTWLYAIARNAVIDYWRRNRSAETLPEDLSDDALPEDGLMRKALLEELARALERLPETLTDIIVLRYYDELPLTEIAETLGMSYSAVKLRHRKALTTLKTVLADD